MATPAATPVTIPPVPTVAVVVVLLLQAPPVVASLNVTVDPVQTDAVPVIGAIAYDDIAAKRATIRRV